MTTSAELTNFWEHFSQTALNKDRGLGVHATLATSPSSTSKRSNKSSNLPTDTSSFVAVPAKRNFSPPSAPSTKAHSSSKKDGNGVKLSTVSKIVASFGRGVASTTGAAVASISTALQPQSQQQQHAVQSSGHHHGDNASFLAPSSTGQIMSATGQQGAAAYTPDAFLNQQVNNSSQIFPTYSLPTSPRPNDAILAKDKSSSTSFLNFRDLLVPHLVSDISPPTGSPPLDLAALVARWPDVLPPDSHWYTMSQLRIHAGAPERSEAGAARLLEYFFRVAVARISVPAGCDAGAASDGRKGRGRRWRVFVV
ncbi:hypothetical protein BCR44DRAFT_1411508 [Catenaria anguillulae PL171]|uniref:Uncharacterized protein n=1 Tax=Catenaria anguillulae PL171 TaxID=765915 RepID=A0A1Y2I144_9FUNG|nr:hypothetical protein BCR44DRAFT_1411508 [Catenaria anguillulae PL171]